MSLRHIVAESLRNVRRVRLRDATFREPRYHCSLQNARDLICMCSYVCAPLKLLPLHPFGIVRARCCILYGKLRSASYFGSNSAFHFFIIFECVLSRTVRSAIRAPCLCMCVHMLCLPSLPILAIACYWISARIQNGRASYTKIVCECVCTGCIAMVRSVLRRNLSESKAI